MDQQPRVILSFIASLVPVSGKFTLQQGNNRQINVQDIDSRPPSCVSKLTVALKRSLSAELGQFLW